MSDELKPCPFCGGDAHLRKGTGDNSEIWFVDCKHYCCELVAVSKGKAIEAWNTRAERTCTNSYEGGCRIAFKCSSCGTGFFYPKQGDNKYLKPSYCPSCGAKVVS